MSGFERDLDDVIERFEERGHRLARKPPRRRSVKSLTLEAPVDNNPFAPKFDDPGLEALHERGHVTDLLWELKTGKEATVYVVSGPRGLMAAKLYVDLRVRSFKKDAIYREGRWIDDARIRKAIERRSKAGVEAQQFLWVAEEFKQLQALHAAGVPVPTPVDSVGNAVLMQFIGDEDGAAPRLSDTSLSRDEAREAFAQCVRNLALILRSGRVHGDYSTFNVLWWQEKAIVIDFPQVVEVEANPAANQILRRDVEGLCRSFGHFGLHPDPVTTLREVQRLARQD
jgi:RIO kinase 1